MNKHISYCTAFQYKYLNDHERKEPECEIEKERCLVTIRVRFFKVAVIGYITKFLQPTADRDREEGKPQKKHIF